MEKPRMRRTAKYYRQHQRKKAWQRAAALMAALTVLFTAYTVILPEATFAEGIYCGLEEHQHTEECFATVCACEWADMVVETLAPHEHTEACVVEHRELTCGLEETEGKPAVIHSHGDACYSVTRELTCTQEETDGKPAAIHTHEDGCYTVSQALTCGLEETEGKPAVTHAHGDGCYSVSRELVCGQIETAGEPAVIHNHGAECYAAAKELTCGKEESTGHVHTAECVGLESVLVCESTQEGHTHTDDCYELVQKTICGKSEGDDAHTHTEDCYTEAKTLICGLDEGAVVAEAVPAHTHTDACYAETKTLTCSLEEGAVVEEAVPGHTHTDACYTEAKTLTCTLEEGAVVEEAVPAHTHTDACYTETKTLTCTLEEGAVVEEAIPAHTHTDECYTVTTTMECPDPTATPEPEHIHTEACYAQALTCELPEHTHELMCYSNPEADVESEADWKRSVSGAKLTGDWGKDLIAVAKTQLGYQESKANYQVNENGEPKGYTRYGAWRGLPYEDWSAMFVAFCLNYAKVPKEAFPREADCAQWVSRLKGRDLYLSRDKADPKPGDIVFFRAEGSGSANHMGIVASVSGGSIHTIEGDAADSVANGSYSMTSDRILGYGVMPENPELEEPAEPTATPVEDETPNEGEEPAEPTATPVEDETPGEGEEPTEPTATPVEDETPGEGSATPVEDEEDAETGTPDNSITTATDVEKEPATDGASQNTVTTFTDMVMKQSLMLGNALPLANEMNDAEGEGQADQAQPSDPNAINLAEGGRIKKVIAMYKEPGGDWIDWPTNGEVHADDELAFTLEYAIAGKTLKDTDTLYYWAPVGLTKEETGPAMSGSNTVGTYHIYPNGLIEVKIDKDFVDLNNQGSNGNPLTGTITFHAKADDVDVNHQGEAKLDFISDTIPIHVTDKVFRTDDLKVTKTQGTVDNAAGTVKYTITVDSLNGTGGQVELNDVMTSMGLDGSITSIIDEHGSTVKPDKSETTADGFNMTLPAMKANGQYVIEYTAKVNNAEGLNGDVDAHNRVDVTSTYSDGGTLADKADVDTKFTRRLLAKDGQVSADGQNIQWTVTVNMSHINIDGWTLSDQMGGSTCTGPVDILPNPETGNDTVALHANLPYTFNQFANDDCKTKTYTVTYTTPVTNNGGVGNNSVTNNASFGPASGGNGVSVGKTVTVSPVKKEGTGVAIIDVTNPDHKLAEFKWSVTIDGPIELSEKTIDNTHYEKVWYYGDELWTESIHWMTGAQLQAMASSLASSLQSIDYTGRYEIYAYKWDQNSKYSSPTRLADIQPGEKYGQFRILFLQELASGKKISFSYASTVDIGDGIGATSLQNFGTVNDVVNSQPNQTYSPIVTKKDKNYAGAKPGQNTAHDFDKANLGDKGGEGILQWDVTVTFPKPAESSDLIITEHLPTGTKLIDSGKYGGEWNLSFYLEGFSNHNFGFGANDPDETEKTLKSSGYTVTAKKLSDTEYTITVPAAMAAKYAGKTATIQVRAQIDDHFNWSGANVDFVNRVDVKTKAGGLLGDASQKQTIHKPLVRKELTDNGSNVLPYTLKINTDGIDLVEGKDELVLQDVFEYTKPDHAVVVSLLLETLHIKKLDSNGAVIEDITDKCKIELNDVYLENKVQKAMEITIPDSTPLLIEYSYSIQGTVNDKMNIVNSATLYGLNDSVDRDESQKLFQIQKAGATVEGQGANVYKHEEGKPKIHLEGAQFKLYTWTDSAWNSGTVYTTDSHGSIALPNLVNNVAYYLEEIAAPAGYELDSEKYFFYLTNNNGIGLSAPADFNGVALSPGTTIMISNAKVKGYRLPSTGGSGTRPYIIGGQVTICAGLALLCGNRKRRKK